MDGWMEDDLRLSVLFNSISAISVRCKDDDEMLFAKEPRLRFERFPLQEGHKLSQL